MARYETYCIVLYCIVLYCLYCIDLLVRDDFSSVGSVSWSGLRCPSRCFCRIQPLNASCPIRTKGGITSSFFIFAEERCRINDWISNSVICHLPITQFAISTSDVYSSPSSTCTALRSRAVCFEAKTRRRVSQDTSNRFLLRDVHLTILHFF